MSNLNKMTILNQIQKHMEVHLKPLTTTAVTIILPMKALDEK